MIFIERKDKWVKAIDHKGQHACYEHGPYRIEQCLTRASSLIKESNYIAYPGKCCKEHENEVKDTGRIDHRKQCGNIMMFIQKSPGDKIP